MSEAFIVAAARTAGGRRGGALAGWHPVDMAGAILTELVRRVDMDPAQIDDVIMGCVGQAGEQSQQIGRSAVLASVLPQTVPAVTIDRQCGSSQQAVQFAAQAVMSGTQDIVIAAGVESMSRVPMGLPTWLPAKSGIGEGPWPPSVLDQYGVREFNQFVGAEKVAEKYGLSRDELDGYALESHRRAAKATQDGAFEGEILPLAIVGEDGATHTHDTDEGIRFNASLEQISSVDPILEGGMVSAASASQMCDGASGVMVVSERAVRDHGFTPLARIHAFSVTAGDPVIMLDEPVPATRKVFERAAMEMKDIDLFEVNEAFAPVPLGWIRAMEADPDKVNCLGGGIALGHPLGATGTKLMTTLVYALRNRRLRWGLQTMCEGGGVANATIIEAL
ncbi:MAG: acetyl-CoA C-acetyltransferase [Sphingomonadaceae bacterium]